MRTWRSWVSGLVLGAGALLVAGSTTASGETDAFQQLTNYLTTGDPLREANGIATARIYDRARCISGMDDRQGGYVRIYWNNVDPEFIEIEYRYFPDNGQVLVMTLAGDDTVADVQPQNGLLYLSLAISGVTEGRHTRVTLPMYNLDPDRLRRALEILYTRHCTGTKSTIAF